MALLINDDCTSCDACKPVCPNDAISVGEPIYVIDPLKCTECVSAEGEPQCKLVGPADCIVSNPDLQESPEELMAKYPSLHGWLAARIPCLGAHFQRPSLSRRQAHPPGRCLPSLGQRRRPAPAGLSSDCSTQVSGWNGGMRFGTSCASSAVSQAAR